VVGGNPDIRPETIRTFEAAMAWTPNERSQVNLSLFRYAMDDIIRGVPNPTPPPANKVQNTGGQTGHGLELEIAWDASRSLRLSGNYAWQRSTDRASGKDAGYAPHHDLYARADWVFARGWLASAQVNAVAGRQRAPGDTRAPIADYATLDLTLRTTQRRSHWDFAVSVRNLFNADAREPSLINGGIPNDLPLARRAFYAQASYGF
jgi:iron complex outermembrane receptor protein